MKYQANCSSLIDDWRLNEKPDNKNNLARLSQTCTTPIMKLFYSTASPYARKVDVTAREAGIIDQIKIISTNTNPVDPNGDIVASNPIGKIPTLVLDDGRAIFDSRVICEYIDSLGSEPFLFPANGDARISAQTLHALGDGILDASLLARYETFLRPAEFRWDKWTDGQRGKISTALDFLENNFSDFFSSSIDIGQITVACALSYIEFREIVDDWRPGRNKLTEWYSRFSQRESMKATEPS